MTEETPESVAEEVPESGAEERGSVAEEVPEGVAEAHERKPFPIAQVVEIAFFLALAVFGVVRAIPTWQGQGDTVAFRIGNFGVRWYGILLMTGAYLGARLGDWLARRRGLDPDHVWNILLWGLILGVTVSRLLYVLGDWSVFSGDPLRIIGIENGQFVGLRGLTIHGALLGAVLAVAIYGVSKRLSLWTWLDVGAPGFVLGQAIGRWGNFFNMEAYGWPTTLPWGLHIPWEHRIPPFLDLGQYPLTTLFHPTFLYESLFNAAVCGFLVFLTLRHRQKLVPGEIFCLYGILYGMGRFGLEFMRTDSIYLGAIPAAQVISIILFVLCAGTLVVRRWLWKPRKA